MRFTQKSYRLKGDFIQSLLRLTSRPTEMKKTYRLSHTHTDDYGDQISSWTRFPFECHLRTGRDGEQRLSGSYVTIYDWSGGKSRPCLGPIEATRLRDRGQKALIKIPRVFRIRRLCGNERGWEKCPIFLKITNRWYFILPGKLRCSCSLSHTVLRLG